MSSAAPDEFQLQLAHYRELVAPRLLATVADREPRRYLYEPIESHLSRAGKGLRPALCLASCTAWGGRVEDALDTATAIELLHNAFLVHDDIEDGSDYRRGQPTLHRRYGIPLALNAGDAMQAMSLQLVRKSTASFAPDVAQRLLDEFDHMLSETLEGQALEMGWVRDNYGAASERDYLQMVLKKTCWYSFIHPCRIGALLAEPGRGDLDRFNSFGFLAGAAFQIQDDVLNLAGERQLYGKEIGGDLWEGKRTLMLAHLQRSLRGREAERLTHTLSKPREARAAHDVAWLHQQMLAYGSIEYARAAAREFAAAAERAFEPAFQGSAPESLGFLRSFVRFLVAREV